LIATTVRKLTKYGLYCGTKGSQFSDYILCPECDAAYTEAHRHGTSVSKKKVEKEKAIDNSNGAATTSEPKPEEPTSNSSEEEESNADEPATESAPVAEEGKAEPSIEAPAETGSKPDADEAQQSGKHDGKHIVLIIKDLKDRSAVKPASEVKDQAIILEQLREDVSSRLGGVDTKINQMDGKFGTMDSKLTSLEARFTKVEDILNRLALHMGL
jgi:hypothetical protein